MNYELRMKMENQISPAVEVTKKSNEENSVFTHFLLIFYCYLLIIVNELCASILRSTCYKSKKMKKQEDQSRMVKKGVFRELSIGKQWEGGFCVNILLQPPGPAKAAHPSLKKEGEEYC